MPSPACAPLGGSRPPLQCGALFSDRASPVGPAAAPEAASDFDRRGEKNSPLRQGERPLWPARPADCAPGGGGTAAQPAVPTCCRTRLGIASLRPATCARVSRRPPRPLAFSSRAPRAGPILPAAAIEKPGPLGRVHGGRRVAAAGHPAVTRRRGVTSVSVPGPGPALGRVEPRRRAPWRLSRPYATATRRTGGCRSRSLFRPARSSESKAALSLAGRHASESPPPASDRDGAAWRAIAGGRPGSAGRIPAWQCRGRGPGTPQLQPRRRRRRRLPGLAESLVLSIFKLMTRPPARPRAGGKTNNG